MKGKTNFSRRLQAARNQVWCLEIIDVGCNLKQFDGLTRLTRSTPLSAGVEDRFCISANVITSLQFCVVYLYFDKGERYIIVILSVSLSVCEQDDSKSYGLIWVWFAPSFQGRRTWVKDKSVRFWAARGKAAPGRRILDLSIFTVWRRATKFGKITRHWGVEDYCTSLLCPKGFGWKLLSCCRMYVP